MTEHNKLPTFGETASIDETIVNDTSILKDRGFTKNTTIKSAEMNTYIKMMTNGFKGLVDTLYKQGISQNNIKANSTAEEWYQYLNEGLTHIIADSNVEKSNVASKLEQSRQITLTGDIRGSGSFDGSQDININTSISKSMSVNLYSWSVRASTTYAGLYWVVFFQFNTYTSRTYVGSSGFEPKLGTIMRSVFGGATPVNCIAYGYDSKSVQDDDSVSSNCRAIAIGGAYGVYGTDTLRFEGTYIQGNIVNHNFKLENLIPIVNVISSKLS